MFLLLSGLGVIAVTAVLFAWMLPRGGKRHRFVGTELESYVAVAFCSAVALSLTMILSGALELLGSP
jgi:hypothetical protein